jgi:hypothetical protein
MKRLLTLPILLLLFFSCKKESDNIIWQRSIGSGNAMCVLSAPDSGIIACGEISDHPFLLKLSRNKNTEISFTSTKDGLFSSAWACDSCIICAGSSGGAMLISRIDSDGIIAWEKIFSSDTGFEIGISSLIRDENNLIAIGSSDPDFSDTGSSGLLFVRFDTAGSFINSYEIGETDFISAGDAVIDEQGNIYLALTRQSTGEKPRASVAKFNSAFQKLWEEELYNNVNFGAGSSGIAISESDSLYITGSTEVNREEGTLDNSYIVSMSKSGIVGKKKYLENSNSGSDLVINDAGEILLLNRNCFIVTIIDPEKAFDMELIRMYQECDSYNTSAYGSSICLHYDGNILAAGSKGGSFYLALKSSSQ